MGRDRNRHQHLQRSGVHEVALPPELDGGSRFAPVRDALDGHIHCPERQHAGIGSSATLSQYVRWPLVMLRLSTCSGCRMAASASCTMSGLFTNGSTGLSRLTNASKEGREKWTDRPGTTFPGAVRHTPGPTLCTQARPHETASSENRAPRRMLRLRPTAAARSLRRSVLNPAPTLAAARSGSRSAPGGIPHRDSSHRDWPWRGHQPEQPFPKEAAPSERPSAKSGQP
jgi:hypothetical protein